MNMAEKLDEIFENEILKFLDLTQNLIQDLFGIHTWVKRNMCAEK